MIAMRHLGLNDEAHKVGKWVDAGLPTSNIVWEMICAYLQILSPSPGADVASDPQDTTQRGEEKKPGGRSTDAAAL